MLDANRTEPRRLESYLAGRWQAGQGDGQVMVDAATGDPVARVDATGLDMQAALDHGRNVGGPALRKMRIHERALMMKQIGLALMEQKEELYALSTLTGATRSDGWVDIDGGIGTLLTYASKGRRELPNGHVIPDGNPEMLSKDGSFIGQHILTPLEGVAIHINAFNFPVWGMLEKLAPTWLAGMPAIVKPASQTSYVTELCVRKILELGILPEGALQLICGSTGDLLDRVTCQDVVTFTGSAATARKLRNTPAIIEHSVRFTAEADSLNACILGPDVTPDSPEFDLFIKEVHREMTVKAGQKCTAIRRAIVPADRVEAVTEALRARFAKTTIGHPGTEGTRMGPLASADQVAEVSSAIEALAREARIVIEQCEVPTDGAFCAPCVLVCDDPLNAVAPHEVEAFGPVCTLMPYDTPEQAVAIANKGAGSLVASVFTDDADAARTLGLGIAKLHGRVLFGNRGSAKTSTGHGSPLPQMIHGGPGRAGGGQELGGMRAVEHFMQRTALQGTPDLLTAVVGKWMPGATRHETDVHPFRKSLAELEIGDTIVTAPRQVTLEDIEHFANFTGDTFYAHMDEDAAKRNPFFEGRVAHGYLIVSFAAGMFVQPDEGPVLANYGVDNLRFMTPVNAGDTLQVQLTAKQITPRETEEYGEVRWDCTVTRDGGEVVAQYDVLTLVSKTQREL
ncbi:phenylacetic acid degradation bifunctional protein PaaZ [Tranquillimonas alkanivorans]|uniref:Oxepin-CoA hydrolase / 3-oxo-5,6-dehydrosuberyl-CoA semialdehyde dehydrogenase n=1 Tax=Tranquillimonas alkanivorans TaxID=441119 RepID=A0A1I5S823_9RHOB|nr:phenylacetic acid degradation bifunctional protein PaaZ [Tranquillimonas alkanivorans]SFP66892.1 oxepin-CoA hydrolase / 3-oxo-5,6-dehydrosuberyl-CoA semialdehyde dehydrogenase [Tranquillimonas alkanivorans]